MRKLFIPLLLSLCAFAWTCKSKETVVPKESLKTGFGALEGLNDYTLLAYNY